MTTETDLSLLFSILLASFSPDLPGSLLPAFLWLLFCRPLSLLSIILGRARKWKKWRGNQSSFLDEMMLIESSCVLAPLQQVASQKVDV